MALSNLEFKGKKVTVIGLARSGAGAANLLHSLGAEVTVTDLRGASELEQYTALLSGGIKKVLGSHPDELFLDADLVVFSPGVPMSAPPLVKAAKAGVPLMGEMELAFRVANSPFIAITGTNGKSTTTTLVGLMLKEAGMKVQVGGNLGNALTEKPEELMDKDYIVAEVSSFQLEGIATFRPKIAALLNITQDHLDRYPDMDSYAEAKALVFKNQTADDFFVVNADDLPSMHLRERARSRKVLFSRKQYIKDGVSIRDGYIISGLTPDVVQEVVPIDKIRIKGVHNLENALAAAAISLAAGAPTMAISKVLTEFPGLEHRLEHVREINGVEYINDSKGTNVGAVEKSVQSFERPVILIAGGLDKHSDFSPLAPLIKARVKKLILIGSAAKVMQKALGGETDTVLSGTLEDAVRMAKGAALPGDVVLLSPACASFDMFKDFEDRGRRFKDIVMGLT